MALKFRTDPLSFDLPASLFNEVKNSASADTTSFIFGYAILFTVDKKKKIKNNPNLHPVKFRKFADTFAKFVASVPERDSDASSQEFSKRQRVANFARCGYYDEKGSWLRSYPLNERQVIVVANEEEARTHAEGLEHTLAAGERARHRSEAFNKMNSSEKNGGRNEATTSSQRQSRSEEDKFAAASATSSRRKQENAERGRTSQEGASKAGDSGAGKDTGFKRTFSSESQRRNAEAANFSSEQAKEISSMASVLLPTSLGLTGVGKYDLRSLQRDKRFRETHVPVSRGNYVGVTRNIVGGAKGGYVITGPTGCGKSTVAILPLFDKEEVTVMMVEPTQANAANILHEFTNILPNMVSSGIITGSVPVTKFVAPTVSRPPYPRLSVTTTDKLLEYFYAEGKFPKVDYVIVDEFHLPIPSMVRTVELVRTFNLSPKYVFVSATAVGFSVSPQLPRAVTHIYGNLPLGEFPGKMERSDLDPRRWFKVGDGTIGVVAPSVVMARRLHKVYKDWQLRSFLVTRETVVSSYMKAATDYSSHTVFVLEPGVEAGVTLSLSVLISMGTTAAVRYDGRVVLEDSQPLDEIAAIQRGGRGGRVKPTVYVTPRAPHDTKQLSTADYFRAQAVIIAVAMGADVSSMRLDKLLDQFPKLGGLTKKYAARAVASGGDPFLAVYKTSPDGRTYKECGGDGSGFEELAKAELFVYHYDGGFFVSPIADFSDLDSKPDTFVVRNSQFDAAGKIVAAIPGLEARYDLEELVAMMVGKFDHYVADLFVRLREIFNKSEPSSYTIGKDRPAEVSDFLSASPPMIKLFDYLKTEPVGVTYKRVVTEKTSGVWSKHSFEHSAGTLNFAFDDKYTKGDSVDVPKLAGDVFRALKGLLCIEILMDGAPDRCVDLREYKSRVPEEHGWFKSKVIGH